MRKTRRVEANADTTPDISEDIEEVEETEEGTGTRRFLDEAEGIRAEGQKGCGTRFCLVIFQSKWQLRERVVLD